MGRRSLFTIGDYGSRGRRWRMSGRRMRWTPIKRRARASLAQSLGGILEDPARGSQVPPEEESNVFIKNVFKSRRKERKRASDRGGKRGRKRALVSRDLGSARKIDQAISFFISHTAGRK